eukprot:s2680_g6.t1
MAQDHDSTLLGLVIQWMALTGVLFHLTALAWVLWACCRRTAALTTARGGVGGPDPLWATTPAPGLKPESAQPGQEAGHEGNGLPIADEQKTHQETLSASVGTRGQVPGHEGSSPTEIKPQPKGSAILPPPKRPKTVAELLGKSRNSFGNLDRISFERLPGKTPDFPPSLPGPLENDATGPSVWGPLEFEAGGLPVPPGGHPETGFSAVVRIANNTATKAKEKLTAIVNLCSPSKKRPLDPPAPSRLPAVAVGARTRGKRNKAVNILAIARRASSNKQATEKLEEDFTSNTSRKVKHAIRATINGVFKESKGTSPMPPSVEKIKLLGGVLKAAKYRASANYLGEYKLMCIEAGHQWTDQFERTIKLAKRSAARASGPKVKAAEIPTSEQGENFAIRITDRPPRKVPLAGELFDFGTIWMLREIELAAVTKDHMSLEFAPKRVRLSKTDQEGAEIKRVLQCVCDQKICDISCPFYVSMRLVDRMVALGLSRACVTQKWKAASKSQLIDDWKLLFGEKASGHSARRTGALRYIRRGWAIPQVAYLGRWKSSVIYEYAAEALESLPVNMGSAFRNMEGISAGSGAAPAPKGPSYEELEEIKNYLLAELDMAKADQSKATAALDAEVEEMKRRNKQSGDRLPPVVQAMTSKIVHYNMDMASCSPPQAWKTLCGWRYHRSDFVFVTKVDGLHLCKKCWDLAQSSRGRNGEVAAEAANVEL